jgi:predicted nucleotidyltransferase
MKTAVELFIEQLEAQGESWENVSIGRIQISIKVEDYLKLKEQAKEMEKEQKIEFAKLHVQTALKAVENEMILQASSVKHWYLPETIK